MILYMVVFLLGILAGVGVTAIILHCTMLHAASKYGYSNLTQVQADVKESMQFLQELQQSAKGGSQ